jgi:hypothetical protein
VRTDLTEAELNGLIADLPRSQLPRPEREKIMRLIWELRRYRDAEAVRHHLIQFEGSY